MDVLAIDLGTKTGYCYNHGDVIHAGTWELAKPKEVTAWGKARLNRRKDPRIKRLCDFISMSGTFDVVAFEDVQFVSTQYQAHLWAGLRSAIWLCGAAPLFECVPVATLKKFATGSGAADKESMARHLLKDPLFGRVPLDENGVDAAWVWKWAQQNLARVKT